MSDHRDAHRLHSVEPLDVKYPEEGRRSWRWWCVCGSTGVATSAGTWESDLAVKAKARTNHAQHQRRRHLVGLSRQFKHVRLYWDKPYKHQRPPVPPTQAHRAEQEART